MHIFFINNNVSVIIFKKSCFRLFLFFWWGQCLVFLWLLIQIQILEEINWLTQSYWIVVSLTTFFDDLKEKREIPISLF